MGSYHHHSKLESDVVSGTQHDKGNGWKRLADLDNIHSRNSPWGRRQLASIHISCKCHAYHFMNCVWATDSNLYLYYTFSNSFPMVYLCWRYVISETFIKAHTHTHTYNTHTHTHIYIFFWKLDYCVICKIWLLLFNYMSYINYTSN